MILEEQPEAGLSHHQQNGDGGMCMLVREGAANAGAPGLLLKYVVGGGVSAGDQSDDDNEEVLAAPSPLVSTRALVCWPGL